MVKLPAVISPADAARAYASEAAALTERRLQRHHPRMSPGYVLWAVLLALAFGAILLDPLLEALKPPPPEDKVAIEIYLGNREQLLVSIKERWSLTTLRMQHRPKGQAFRFYDVEAIASDGARYRHRLAADGLRSQHNLVLHHRVQGSWTRVLQ